MPTHGFLTVTSRLPTIHELACFADTKAFVGANYDELHLDGRYLLAGSELWELAGQKALERLHF